MREQGTEGGTEGDMEGGRAGGRKVRIRELEGRKVGGERRKDGGREEGKQKGGLM